MSSRTESRIGRCSGSPPTADSGTGSIGFRESIVERIRQTVREYLRETRYSGSGHGGFVGTPEQLVRIEHWYLSGASDGFNLQPVTLPVIADEVVPLLQRRGLFRRKYETDTLRGDLKAATLASA